MWLFSEYQALKVKFSKPSGFKNVHRKKNSKKLDNILRQDTVDVFKVNIDECQMSRKNEL